MANHPIDVAVGARVKELRIRAGISQTALADELGVSFQQVQKYERGSNRMGASRLVQTAHALGVPVTSLFESVAPESGKAPEKPLDAKASKLARDWAAISNEKTRETLRQVIHKMAQAEK